MKTIKFLLAMLVSIVLVGCSSGGSSTPTPTTYGISGTVTLTGAALPGVTVALGGTSTATATTDASGNYSFTGLADGSYTVTPTKTGDIFVPNSLAVTVSGANVSAQNFAATANSATTYSISGVVSGAVTSGVTITLSGGAGSTVTVVGGAYSFSGLLGGNYTITPSLVGYSFAPTSLTITGLAANSAANNFVATLIPVAHPLTGNVSPTLAGVTITAVTGGTTVTATTDASGNYSVNLFDGTYAVTPSLSGYLFAPNNATVIMAGAAKTQNFAATANSSIKATANGTVTGSWVEGVTITASGTGLPTPLPTATTNASGNYSITNLPSGQTYTFTPSLVGYTFGAAPTATIPAGSSTAVTVPAITATSAIASYSISGTVAYPGAKTGAVRIQAYYTGCTNCGAAGGTVITAPGAYTIRGLQNGSYNVIAGMDAQGNGQANASNPVSPAVAVTITNANGAASPVLADPGVPPTPVTPTGLGVAPGSGGGLLIFNPPADINGQEIATSYQLTWGTTIAATGSGSANLPAQGTNNGGIYLLSGLTNGTAYYFKITACVGGTIACVGGAPSAASTAVGPITINATTGANTVSGAVTFSGTAAVGAPMYIAIHNNGGGGTFVAYVTRIAAPLTSPVSYSIAGVPAGSYSVSAIIDQNNNGLSDVGDISNFGGNGLGITVAGATTANLTLSSAPSTAQIGTDHWTDGVNNSYNINTALYDGVKRMVSATLFSGLNVAVPLDMKYGNCYGTLCSYTNSGVTAPTVGDTYQFKVTYSDGTSAIISSSVTAVLNSFANGLAVTSPTAAQPTFTWTAPTVGVPASYLYSLNVNPSAGGPSWYYPQNSNGMPSSQLSVVYNVDGTAPALGGAGTCMGVAGTCNWQVQVKDANSLNSASMQSTFTH